MRERNLGIASNSNSPPNNHMDHTEEGWLYDGSSVNRLWEKSALGRILDNGKLLLSSSELIFCINHRNIPPPNQDWLAESVTDESGLLEESAVLEALRVPGNRVMIGKNIALMGHNSATSSWAVRWSSDKHPKVDHPVSEIIYFHSDDKFDENELYEWCKEVTELNRIAEVLVVDEEQSVVTYRLNIQDIKGNMGPLDLSLFKKIVQIDHITTASGGAFFPNVIDWPLEIVGIPLHGGRQVDPDELNIIRTIGNIESDFDLDTSSVSLEQADIFGLTMSSSLLLELWGRGLNTRSGFKYGTSWRCYPGGVGEGHAPWLVIDPYSKKRENITEDWSDACLSSRLAAGVNKQWVYPVRKEGVWKFLEVSRPPSDSRWTNPTRK